jgi:DNA-binding GntR family transcriptional regulator
MTIQTENYGLPTRVDVRRIILERIVRGELPPGVRIKESRLADELGISRTPIREALIKLEQEGFVRSELSHGFSVEPLSGREVRETYPILWTLEGLAFRASGNAIYSLLGELTRINAAFSEAGEPEASLNLDTEWHEKLLSNCPNRRLHGMISNLRTVIRRYERLFMSDSNLIVESVNQHQGIIDALQARNIGEAERILTENWRGSMELLLVRLGEP